MIYHLTRRDYLIVTDEGAEKESILDYCEAIEKWEVNKILNTGEPEIENLIKSN